MTEKKVDEEWKKQMQKEREKEQEQCARPGQLPGPTFMHIVSLFATQAMFQLGEIENPLSGKREVDLNTAKYSIDTLQLLKEKTAGNLTPQEECDLDRILYDLRMCYVSKTGTLGR